MTVPDESRLLFLLLEGAQDEARLRDLPAESRWLDLRRRYDASHPEEFHAELLALFREVERTEVLVGTWIQFRWRKARSATPGAVSKVANQKSSPAPPG